MKRLQNRIAESGLVLPLMSLYALVVWLLAGLLRHWWWPQLACFILSAYLMVELNNANSLLRVRSRMVSGVFIGLSCTMSFLFGSLSGALVQLFFIASLLLLFSLYQSPQLLGRIFYAFLLLGLSSLLSVYMLLLVPLLWLLMATHLQSMTWRGLFASLIGLVTPYWFVSLWFILQRDFTLPAAYFAALTAFIPPPDAYAAAFADPWALGRLLAYVLTAVLSVVGVVHFWRQGIDEKIRTRLLYGFFAWLTAALLLLVALQPQLYDPLMRMALVCASPLVAHFMTLSSSRLTNIAFFVILAAALAVTAAGLFL